jgi:UDP-N-acetylglucosamine acyltransferase
VHQFVRLGAHAMIGGMSGVENDVIPYGMVKGERAYLAGLNLVGLERRGFGRDDIHELRNAYKKLFAADGTMATRVDEVAAQYKDKAHIASVVEFIRARASRALCQPKNNEE